MAAASAGAVPARTGSPAQCQRGRASCERRRARPRGAFAAALLFLGCFRLDRPYVGGAHGRRSDRGIVTQRFPSLQAVSNPRTQRAAPGPPTLLSMTEVEALLSAEAGRAPPGSVVFHARALDAPTRRARVVAAVVVGGIAIACAIARADLD